MKQDDNANNAANNEDLIATVSKTAKVAPSSERRRYMDRLVLVITVGVAVSVMFFFTGGKASKAQPRKSHVQENHIDFKKSLAINMEKLNATRASINDMKKTLEHKLHQPKINKAYLARQHAPTSMYVANTSSSNIPTYTNANPTASTAILLGHGANVQFANQTSTVTTVHANALQHPEYTLVSGELLHGVLETAIHSDLPGMVRATLSEPAYAYVGKRVLMPAGSRLIGQYAANIAQGQRRIFIVWQRVVMPNGVSVQINSPGTDRFGRAGQGADTVNTHFWSRFGEATLLSLLGAGSATYGVNSGAGYNSLSMYRSAVAESFNEAAQQSLQHTLPVKPTLTIRQGARINIFVARDVDFANVYEGV